MKKKILKNVAILSLALFGLGIIGHNVFADSLHESDNALDGGGLIIHTCEMIYNGCGDGGCTYMNARRTFLISAFGCTKKCDRVCMLRTSSIIDISL